MRVASVVVGPCPSYLPTNPLLRPPELRAPPNWPEVALIRSPSVDAPSIVSASGEPRQKLRWRKVSTHLHLLNFTKSPQLLQSRSQPIAALASPTTGSRTRSGCLRYPKTTGWCHESSRRPPQH